MLDRCLCTIVHHCQVVVVATVDFPNYCHHFLIQNVASDPLGFGVPHQIYVYRLLKFHIQSEVKEEEFDENLDERKIDLISKNCQVNVSFIYLNIKSIKNML